MQSLINEFWNTERVDAMWPVLQAHHHGREAIRQAWAAVPDRIRLDLAQVIQAGRQTTLAATVHVLPVLSAVGCASILEQSEAYSWAENEAEDAPLRMKEVVLADVDPDFDQKMHSVLMSALAPWWIILRGRLPSQVISTQLARYDADDRTGGNYHCDRQSDFSAVISLNSDFEGGGFDIQDGLIGEFHLPAIPVGYAVLIDGQRTIHKGAPITSGSKQILVSWSQMAPVDIW